MGVLTLCVYRICMWLFSVCVYIIYMGMCIICLCLVTVCIKFCSGPPPDSLNCLQRSHLHLINILVDTSCIKHSPHFLWNLILHFSCIKVFNRYYLTGIQNKIKPIVLKFIITSVTQANTYDTTQTGIVKVIYKLLCLYIIYILIFDQ